MGGLEPMPPSGDDSHPRLLLIDLNSKTPYPILIKMGYVPKSQREKLNAQIYLSEEEMQKHISKGPIIKKTHGGTWGHLEADGTIYKAFMIPVKNFELEMLGYVGDGFLVVNGLNRTAHLLRGDRLAGMSYIQEKFDMRSTTDTRNFMYLLEAMNPGWSG